MSVTLKADVGAADANSYGTLDEANAYFASRLPLDPAWEDADDPTAALAMACRVLEGFANAPRKIVERSGRQWYLTARKWTGAPATTTQKLSWPRTGMFNVNGQPIDPATIPDELKQAQFELAGQLIIADRTLDNEVSVAGLTSLRAGSVSLTFKDIIERKLIPDAVLDLLLPGWLTDETLSPLVQPSFMAL